MRKLSVLVLSLLLISGCQQTAVKPDIASATGLDKGIQPPAVTDAAPGVAVGVSREEARNAYHHYLKGLTEQSELQRHVKTRLAYLELELSEEWLSDEDATSAEKSERINAGIARSIELFEQLLADYPADPNNVHLLYQLARAYEQNLETDKVLSTLELLLRQFPRAAYYEEVRFRLAESHFVRTNYARAEAIYNEVLASRSAEAQKFAVSALYKRGWARARQSRHQQALDDYFAVLDRNAFSDKAELSQAEQQLYDDTLRAITLSFNHLGGVRALNQYFASRRGNPYMGDIYRALATMYLDQERYNDAVSAYQDFLSQNADSQEAPRIFLDIIEIWKQGGFPQRVLQAREDFVKRFRLNSSYWTWYDIAKMGDVKQQLQDTQLDDERL